jgi:glycosyltransferase involved in cell wall biosynthesis
MNILLYQGAFVYDVANYFIEELAKNFYKKNHKVYICDLKDIKNEKNINELEKFIIEKNIDFVFSFNSINGVKPETYEGLNIIFGTMLIDHPFFQTIRLDNFPQKNSFLCVYDEGRISTTQRYIDKEVTIKHMMHGGSESKISNDIKKYDVIVAGGLEKSENFEDRISEIEHEEYKKIAKYLYNSSKENYKKTIDAYLEEYLEEHLEDIKNQEYFEIENFRDYITYIYRLVDLFLRNEVRYKSILSLAENGIEINYFGSSTCEELDKYHNFKNNGTVKYTELLDIMKQSKILINTLPYFDNGSHERIFSAMLNNTMVISNENNYCFDIYKDKESIVMFDFNKENDLVDKVKYYLKNEEERNQIVKNAYEITSKYNTWEHRADEILQIYDEIRKEQI